MSENLRAWLTCFTRAWPRCRARWLRSAKCHNKLKLKLGLDWAWQMWKRILAQQSSTFTLFLSPVSRALLVQILTEQSNARSAQEGRNKVLAPVLAVMPRKSFFFIVHFLFIKNRVKWVNSFLRSRSAQHFVPLPFTPRKLDSHFLKRWSFVNSSFAVCRPFLLKVLNKVPEADASVDSK